MFEKLSEKKTKKNNKTTIESIAPDFVYSDVSHTRQRTNKNEEIHGAIILRCYRKVNTVNKK